MFGRVGNQAERKRIFTHALKLDRERGDRLRVARALERLSEANQRLGLYEEGIRQAREASEIFEELGNTEYRVISLNSLALALCQDNQLAAAEDAAFRAIALAPDLSPETGQEIRLCVSHRFLGVIYQQKREKEKAVHHFETAINIASSVKSDGELFWNHLNLAYLFFNHGEFDEADTHAKQAKSHAVNDAYNMGSGMEIQARIWDRQDRLEDAKSEVLRALEILENLGAEEGAERCTAFLRKLNER